MKSRQAILDYKDVRIWDDLIRTNIEFLEGRRTENFYSSSPFHDAYNKDAMHFLKPDLLRLHLEHGIFTTNGQNNMVPKPGTNGRTQRGYLIFTCCLDFALDLVTQLLKDPRLYIYFRFGGFNVSNYPEEEAIPLTDEPNGPTFSITEWEDTMTHACTDSAYASDLENIGDILDDSLHVHIMYRTFPSSTDDCRFPEITTCLLEALERERCFESFQEMAAGKKVCFWTGKRWTIKYR